MSPKNISLCLSLVSSVPSSLSFALSHLLEIISSNYVLKSEILANGSSSAAGNIFLGGVEPTDVKNVLSKANGVQVYIERIFSSCGGVDVREGNMLYIFLNCVLKKSGKQMETFLTMAVLTELLQDWADMSSALLPAQLLYNIAGQVELCCILIQALLKNYPHMPASVQAAGIKLILTLMDYVPSSKKAELAECSLPSKGKSVSEADLGCIRHFLCDGTSPLTTRFGVMKKLLIRLQFTKTDCPVDMFGLVECLVLAGNMKIDPTSLIGRYYKTLRSTVSGYNSQINKGRMPIRQNGTLHMKWLETWQMGEHILSYNYEMTSSKSEEAHSLKLCVLCYLLFLVVGDEVYVDVLGEYIHAIKRGTVNEDLLFVNVFCQLGTIPWTFIKNVVKMSSKCPELLSSASVEYILTEFDNTPENENSEDDPEHIFYKQSQNGSNGRRNRLLRLVDVILRNTPDCWSWGIASRLSRLVVEHTHIVSLLTTCNATSHHDSVFTCLQHLLTATHHMTNTHITKLINRLISILTQSPLIDSVVSSINHEIDYSLNSTDGCEVLQGILTAHSDVLTECGDHILTQWSISTKWATKVFTWIRCFLKRDLLMSPPNDWSQSFINRVRQCCVDELMRLTKTTKKSKLKTQYGLIEQLLCVIHKAHSLDSSFISEDMVSSLRVMLPLLKSFKCFRSRNSVLYKCKAHVRRYDTMLTTDGHSEELNGVGSVKRTQNCLVMSKPKKLCA